MLLLASAWHLLFPLSLHVGGGWNDQMRGLWSKMSCSTLPGCHQQCDSLTRLAAAQWMPRARTSCFAAAGQTQSKGDLQHWDRVDTRGKNLVKLPSPSFPRTQKYLCLLGKLPSQHELLHSTDNLCFHPHRNNSDYMSFLAWSHKMLRALVTLRS